MDLTGDYRLTSLKRVEKIPVGIEAYFADRTENRQPWPQSFGKV